MGRRVRIRRTLLGLSQAELAAQLSFSRQQMALVERGEVRLFASHLYLLGRVLGVPVDFFFGLEEAQSDASAPASTSSHGTDPIPADTSLDVGSDWRSNREVRQWIKAFLRIPSGTSRSRLLTFIIYLAGQPDLNTQLKLLRKSDD